MPDTSGAEGSRGRDPAITSRMMAKVRSKNSKAELAPLRRALHARGLRYRLHSRDVLGHPDIAIRSRKLAVFVDGDMWHGNERKRRGPDQPRRHVPHPHRVVGQQDRSQHASRRTRYPHPARNKAGPSSGSGNPDVLTDPDRAARTVLHAIGHR